jgi:putative acetyltransferase
MNIPATHSTDKKQFATFEIRPIQPEDNEQTARLIRTVMTEFGCVGEGYSILDPEVDDMFGAYNHDRAAFFVITRPGDGTVLGCGGIGPLSGGDELTCELKKMYFYPELRGHGLGREMVARCLEAAHRIGYRRCYLETVARMEQANRLYRKMGFKKMDGPMGSTGHSSCEAWYLKEMSE